ncbi:MAG TPA: DUF4178 domain-containing protein [Bryobacteraceae bacterium]|nr:DUF4178 domain-containing protein [Bryobacteraceae bacterium]
MDLRTVGEVASIPDDASPIQVGTEGAYRNTAFQVVGRIAYGYEQGSWNEWHLIFNDGKSGWLSDAQLEYAVSFLTTPPASLPGSRAILVDHEFSWNDAVYRVTSVTEARYSGVEGELPFEYWGKELLKFVDLRTRDGRFGTIDYSEDPPLLFLGEGVTFSELKLKNLREFEGWRL